MSSSDAMKSLIAKVVSGNVLSTDEARSAFDIMMSGDATPAQIASFLTALHMRGETPDEIAAGAQVMREKALKVEAPAGAIDNCGTGGDASGTWNISTGAAFVIAACGVPIAKHGNRNLSSKSGGAQVLEELGVKIDIPPERISECIRQTGMGFMMAPNHHAATRHVAPVRVELGIRTIFNLLGPLSNPAGTKRQLIGVFAQEWLEPFAQVLKKLGSEKAWIVHGSDGLDEITTTGATHVAALENGDIRTFTIGPEDAGLPIAAPADLKGGDPTHNAAKLKAMLEGETGAYRDIVCLNAGAALLVADKVQNLKDGVAAAQESIDQGAALKVLNDLVAFTNAVPS